MSQQSAFNWYGSSDAVAISGQKADSSTDIVDSYAAEEVIAPGSLVIRGTNPETQTKLATSNTSEVIGVAIHKHIDPLYNGAGYPIGAEVPIMRFGRVYVKAGTAITAGAQLMLGADAQHVIVATTGKKVIGRAMTTVTAAEDLLIVEVNAYGPIAS